MVSMFVEEGSLDRYVHLHKDDLNSFTLLSWAEQIADGMAYLEERGIIHRYVVDALNIFAVFFSRKNAGG